MSHSQRPTTSLIPLESKPVPVECQKEPQLPTSRRIAPIDRPTEYDPSDESLDELRERWRFHWVGDPETWSGRWP